MEILDSADLGTFCWLGVMEGIVLWRIELVEQKVTVVCRINKPNLARYVLVLKSENKGWWSRRVGLTSCSSNITEPAFYIPSEY